MIEAGKFGSWASEYKRPFIGFGVLGWAVAVDVDVDVWRSSSM